jgi:hypothetical protein
MNHPWELSPFSIFTEDGDPDYKKVLAHHPEFTLVEHFREGGPTSVELSPEVERAYRKARGGIQDSREARTKTEAKCIRTVDQKLELAEALEKLGKLGELRKGAIEGLPEDELAMFAKLALPHLLSLIDNIGRPIAEAVRKPKTHGREDDLEALGTALKNACLNVHRMSTPITKEAPDGRELLPINRIIIPIAIGQFQRERKRPTKSAIKKLLQAMGYTKEKNWKKKFEEAGLSRLKD